MVSKSKILGKSSLIFVAVGTAAFNFDRLFKSLDTAFYQLHMNPKLIVQRGSSTYQWKHINPILYNYITPTKMRYYLSRAEKIITHGGFGTMFQIVAVSKFVPLVVPRLAKYHEHINNHQKTFCNYLKSTQSTKRFNFVCRETSLTNDIIKYMISPKIPMRNGIFFSDSMHDLENKIINYIRSNV